MGFHEESSPEGFCFLLLYFVDYIGDPVRGMDWKKTPKSLFNLVTLARTSPDYQT